MKRNADSSGRLAKGTESLERILPGHLAKGSVSVERTQPADFLRGSVYSGYRVNMAKGMPEKY